MAHSVVDPVARIEGHLSIEMEVEDGKVTEAWTCGNLYRGLEHALEGRTPYDAALISERICGVCPVSHAHASCFAAEEAYGIQIPEAARLIRNLAEGGQILHSTILWFYNLAGLDYINPLDALNANPADAYDVCRRYGTSGADFEGLHERLKAFAANGQLSIFTGNWFDCKDADGSSAFHLSPAENLVGTAHYFEGIENQAKASQTCAIIGGKMPHIMTSIPGGTSFVPTPEKLDEIIYRIRELKTWVRGTMIPDMYMIVEKYPNLVGLGKGAGRFVSFGVLDSRRRHEGAHPALFHDVGVPGVHVHPCVPVAHRGRVPGDVDLLLEGDARPGVRPGDHEHRRLRWHGQGVRLRRDLQER